MNFDSTAYLAYSLKDKFQLEDVHINKCIDVLNGLVIKPGSIKFNEEESIITLTAFVPNSELIIRNITIKQRGPIQINAILRNITINVEHNIYVSGKEYSIIFDDESSKSSGIYYYDRAFDGYDFKGRYSYYDFETLKTIKEFYMPEFSEKVNNSNSLIGYNQDGINKLGFTPDIIKWEDKENEDQKNGLTKINYDDIIEKLSNFQEEYSSSMVPVTRKK